MLINLTKRERATVLAALRRWFSYPAARDADSIATNGGRHKPLDNGEIDRLCKRINGPNMKPATTRVLDQGNNGARERKSPKVQDRARKARIGGDLRLGDRKRRRPSQ